jgi:hypothetical protein
VSSYKSTSGPGVGFYVAAVFIVGIVALFWWLWGGPAAHGFYVFFTGGAYIFLPMVGIAVLIGLAFIPNGFARALGTVGAIGLTVVSIFVWSHYNYDMHRNYVADVKVVDEHAPDFDDRAPYDVASASSTRNLGDTTGAARGVKILPDEGDHGLWTALVERRGLVVGYESVQVQNTPLYGSTNASKVTTCKFDTVRAGLRLGGVWPADALDREVFNNTPPSVYFDDSDAYGYCDGTTPIVAVPLKSLDGFWTPSWTAYGVALYNGRTGALDIRTDTEGIPGPVYPQSLAKEQRESLFALGNFDDAWFGRSGYKTSNDEDDPNGTNPAEISLRDADTGDASYVTPLTPPGSSNSVVALSVVDGTTTEHGTRNALTVYKYQKRDARQANSSIAAAIKTQYSWMPDWASGLTIFELVPGKDGEWVASIGKNQSIVYRAVVEADGKAVLYDENGNEVTRTNGSTDQGGGNTPTADSDLKKLTKQQLAELGQAILNELASRAGDTATSTATPTPTATPKK